MALHRALTPDETHRRNLSDRAFIYVTITTRAPQPEHMQPIPDYICKSAEYLESFDIARKHF
eukprot:3352783-Pyramimonas_sp.AAC.1